MKDPYQIFCQKKKASLDDIKKSYRKFTKNYLPDLNPGNKEASHASDQIGTVEARAKFDQGETDEQQQRQYEEFMRKQSDRQSPGKMFIPKWKLNLEKPLWVQRKLSRYPVERAYGSRSQQA